MREDWVLCNKGECKCLTISDRASDSPVCKVFDGKWGDDYPALRIVGDSLQQKVEPYMEQITYGEIPHEEAVRRARLIAAAPDLLAVLRDVEWSGGMEGTDQDEDDFMVCPCCPSCGVPSSEVGTHEDDPFEPGVHDEGCALAAAIAKAEGR